MVTRLVNVYQSLYSNIQMCNHDLCVQMCNYFAPVCSFVSKTVDMQPSQHQIMHWNVIRSKSGQMKISKTLLTDLIQLFLHLSITPSYDRQPLSSINIHRRQLCHHMHDWTHASTLPTRARLHIRLVHAFMRHFVIKHTRNRRPRTREHARLGRAEFWGSSSHRANNGGQRELKMSGHGTERKMKKKVDLKSGSRSQWIYRSQSTRWVGFTASIQHNSLSTPKKNHYSNYSQSCGFCQG